jgi:deoxyribonuclease-4
MIFGTAGVPLSAKERSSLSGLERVAELGLGAMELEFVHSVRMGEKTARQVGELAHKLSLSLSIHAPYYINLCSEEEEKRAASRKRIVDSARVGHWCGAKSIVFHPGFYGKLSPEEAYRMVSKELKLVLEETENFTPTLRPELLGKKSQFGSLEELLRLSQELPLLPCIDFSHLHARTGRFNTFPEFCQVLDNVEGSLGREALENLHLHISGIEYGPSGERKHMVFADSDFNYQELMAALKDRGASGVAICESPNLEEDTLILQNTYLEK